MSIDADKVEKKEVDYSEGHYSAHCGHVPTWPNGHCRYFIYPFSCEKVKGYIEPKYWCKLWAADK